jgi:hypothetical protein
LSQLTEALKRADADGIEVIGMCVGMDRSFVSKAYKLWLTVALPEALPTAIRSLFSELAGTESGAAQAQDPEAKEWTKFRVDLATGLSDTSEAFARGLSAFPTLAQDLKNQVCRCVFSLCVLPCHCEAVGRTGFFGVIR